MSTSELNTQGFTTLGRQSVTHNPAGQLPALQRVRPVRQEPGLSLRRVAQQVKMDIEMVREDTGRYPDMQHRRRDARQHALARHVAARQVEHNS